jgi:hypothetical protein
VSETHSAQVSGIPRAYAGIKSRRGQIFRFSVSVAPNVRVAWFEPSCELDITGNSEEYGHRVDSQNHLLVVVVVKLRTVATESRVGQHSKSTTIPTNNDKMAEAPKIDLGDQFHRFHYYE